MDENKIQKDNLLIRVWESIFFNIFIAYFLAVVSLYCLFVVSLAGMAGAPSDGEFMFFITAIGSVLFSFRATRGFYKKISVENVSFKYVKFFFLLILAFFPIISLIYIILNG